MFQGLIPGDWEVGAFQRGLLEVAGCKELADEQRRSSNNNEMMYRNTALRSICELVNSLKSLSYLHFHIESLQQVAYLCVYLHHPEPGMFWVFVLFWFWTRVFLSTPVWSLPWQSPASAFKVYCKRQQFKVLSLPLTYCLKHWTEGLTAKKLKTSKLRYFCEAFTIKKSCSHQRTRLFLYSLLLVGQNQEQWLKGTRWQMCTQSKEKLSSM